MDLSVAIFFLEMLRASCGGVLAAAKHWQAEQAILETERGAAAQSALEQAAQAEVECNSIAKGVAGTRISRGAVFVQEPIGLLPKAEDLALQSQRSIISIEGDEPQDFLAQLVQSGVAVEPGPIQTSGSDASAMSGGSTPFPSPRYRLRQYTIYPPTPYVEPFTLMVPSPLPATAQPLLVVFHKYGSSYNDVLQNTDYVHECAKRGWFMVCPLGGSKKHFGSVESQVNTEAVLDWMLANSSLRIDRQRIYAVGFSMGGGAVLNYAARHRNPAHAIFAAVINHSGGVCLNDVYLTNPPARYILDFWFGDGSVGSADRWQMNRSSVIDFDPVTLAIDMSSDLSRNLSSTPVSTWRASLDLVECLPRENDVLDHHFQADLGRVPGATYNYNVVPFSGHEWRMLDASVACDWLGQFTLQVPSLGRTLADVDGIYDSFYVEQDASGAFTPFDWSLDAQNNALHLSATANLKRLSLDPIAAGLSTSSALQVFTATADGTGDSVVLAHWPQFPSAVTRDGIATASWNFDAQTLDLTLLETDGAAHTWIVTP